jgi:hypothetical protein
MRPLIIIFGWLLLTTTGAPARDAAVGRLTLVGAPTIFFTRMVLSPVCLDSALTEFDYPAFGDVRLLSIR